MLRLRHVSFAVLLLAAMALPADAGLLLRADASSTLVSSGDDVTITLTIEDDGSIDTALGLFSGSHRLLVNDGGTATAAVDSALDIFGNPLFTNIATLPFDRAFPESAPLGYTNLAGVDQDIFAFGSGVAVPTAFGEIELANYIVRITGAPGSSVTLTSSSLGEFFDGVVGFDNTKFDPLMRDSVTITIAGANNIVPEPSSMAIFALGTMLCVGRRRRTQA